MPDPRLVAQPIEIGPFFAGDTLPGVEFTLLWDAGGTANIGAGATVTAEIRRWDPRREIPIPGLIASGPTVITDPATGSGVFDWTDASPVPSVPIDSGYYVMQLVVTFDAAATPPRRQRAQQIIFQVLAWR